MQNLECETEDRSGGTATVKTEGYTNAICGPQLQAEEYYTWVLKTMEDRMCVFVCVFGEVGDSEGCLVCGALWSNWAVR